MTPAAPRSLAPALLALTVLFACGGGEEDVAPDADGAAGEPAAEAQAQDAAGRSGGAHATEAVVQPLGPGGLDAYDALPDGWTHASWTSYEARGGTFRSPDGALEIHWVWHADRGRATVQEGEVDASVRARLVEHFDEPHFGEHAGERFVYGDAGDRFVILFPGEGFTEYWATGLDAEQKDRVLELVVEFRDELAAQPDLIALGGE